MLWSVVSAPPSYLSYSYWHADLRKIEFAPFPSKDFRTFVLGGGGKVKGNLTRDFRPQVFFMNYFPRDPWVFHWDHYFLRKFAEIFESQTLKGHGNEADFLGFLQKFVPHRSLTLPFEPFRFWLRIREDIRNRKTFKSRLSDSPTRRVGESAFECLNENSESRRVGYGESANRYSNFWDFSSL